MENYVQLLIYLAGPAIIGIVSAIIAQYREFYQFKLHVAENYLKKSDIEELKMDSKEMKKMIYQIAGKVGVGSPEER